VTLLALVQRVILRLRSGFRLRAPAALTPAIRLKLMSPRMTPNCLIRSLRSGFRLAPFGSSATRNHLEGDETPQKTAQVSVPANNLQSKLYNLKVIDANAVQKFQFFVFKQFGRNSLASKHRNVVPLCSTYQQQTGSVPGVEGGLCRPRVDFYFCFLCRV
jgi:hypothetical protein